MQATEAVRCSRHLCIYIHTAPTLAFEFVTRLDPAHSEWSKRGRSMIDMGLIIKKSRLIMVNRQVLAIGGAKTVP